MIETSTTEDAKGCSTTITMSSSAPRMPQVQEQLDRLEKSVTNLEGAYETIIQRLTPILVEEEKKVPEVANGIVNDPLCPMAERIRIIAEQVEGVVGKIRVAGERLEV